MSTTVKTGWLKDKNGDKFSPRTLISQVQTSDGTPLEDKIANDISEVAEKIVPSDWNADEDEAGHVLNRTHWSETVYGEILPPTTFNAGGSNPAQLPLTVLEAGKTYTVVYDGTTYTCEAKDGEVDGVYIIGVGNDMFFGGEQTGEPFGMAYAPDNNFTGIIPLADTDSVHSVQITGEKTVYHKIPREYLYSKRIEFTLGGEDVPGYWNAYTNTDIRDIINDAENGVFQYATITFPMDVDERTADMHLTMPLTSHETFTMDDGITVHRVQFECEMELDERYVFVITMDVAPEIGVSVSCLSKRVADSIKVDTAEVGQTIVVKSVDESGKPTAWEAEDLSKSYRIIADVTLAETVSEIKIEKDTEDNPFELEDVYVYVSSILAEESTVEYSGSHIDIKACDVNGYTHHYHNACFIGSSLKPTAVPFTVRIKHLVDQNKDISILPTGNDEGTAQKTVTTNFIGKHKGWTAIPNGKIRGVLLRTFSPSAAFYGAGTRVMIIGR